MPLREAARFATLQEAEIACSALNAYGLSAVVFDRTYGANNWVGQFVLGGLRVVVPTSQVEDARAILGVLRPADRSALRWGHAQGRFSGIPLAVLALLLTDGGWALGLMRTRITVARLLVVAIYLAAWAVLAAPFFMTSDR